MCVRVYGPFYYVVRTRRAYAAVLHLRAEQPSARGRYQAINLARRSMHLSLHICSSRWAVRYSLRLPCQQLRPDLRPQRVVRRLASPTTSVLSPSQPQIRLPGVGDLRNLNVDLGDVPDGRYREVEVRSL